MMCVLRWGSLYEDHPPFTCRGGCGETSDPPNFSSLQLAYPTEVNFVNPLGHFFEENFRGWAHLITPLAFPAFFLFHSVHLHSLSTTILPNGSELCQPLGPLFSGVVLHQFIASLHPLRVGTAHPTMQLLPLRGIQNSKFRIQNAFGARL